MSRLRRPLKSRYFVSKFQNAGRSPRQPPGVATTFPDTASPPTLPTLRAGSASRTTRRPGRATGSPSAPAEIDHANGISSAEAAHGAAVFLETGNFREVPRPLIWDDEPVPRVRPEQVCRDGEYRPSGGSQNWAWGLGPAVLMPAAGSEPPAAAPIRNNSKLIGNTCSGNRERAAAARTGPGRRMATPIAPEA